MSYFETFINTDTRRFNLMKRKREQDDLQHKRQIIYGLECQYQHLSQSLWLPVDQNIQHAEKLKILGLRIMGYTLLPDEPELKTCKIRIYPTPSEAMKLCGKHTLREPVEIADGRIICWEEARLRYYHFQDELRSLPQIERREENHRRAVERERFARESGDVYIINDDDDEGFLLDQHLKTDKHKTNKHKAKGNPQEINKPAPNINTCREERDAINIDLIHALTRSNIPLEKVDKLKPFFL
ncbi:4307_t:CDS:2, partial [Racocetra persica]